MRIIFNGQEYDSIESMPPDARRAYEEALSGLVDVARSSSPLVRALMPRAHSEHYLRAHQRAKQTAAWMVPVLMALVLGGMLIAGVWLLGSMTPGVEERTGDPFIGPALMMAVALIAGIGAVVVFLYRKVDSPGTAATEEGAPPAGNVPPGGLDAAQSTLGPLLAFVAGFVLVVAVTLIVTIGGGREHLAGRLTVAIPALLVLSWLDSYAVQLAKRREALLGPDSPGYRQFVVWSSLGLLLSAVVLLGLACFSPPEMRAPVTRGPALASGSSFDYWERHCYRGSGSCQANSTKNLSAHG